MEAMTVSQGRSKATARARTTDVFPVPGAPHKSTGMRAATESASASTTAG